MTTGVSTSNATLAATNQTAASAASATAASKSATSKSSLAQNFNTFLTMLTTQLKHQDPLSPMDSTQFTNQLVQFAGVEQQINVNSNMEKLISISKVNQLSGAVGYLGQTIESEASQLPLQNGVANFSYTLPSEARAVAVVVKDATGKIVANLAGEGAVGRHEMTWNGLDTNGVKLPDGAYAYSVVAVDGQQQTISATSTVYGKVTDVASDATSGTLLGMGKVVTTIDKVLTIRDGASVQSSATSTN